MLCFKQSYVKHIELLLVYQVIFLSLSALGSREKKKVMMSQARGLVILQGRGVLD
jgi:hypothetical protein